MRSKRLYALLILSLLIGAAGFAAPAIGEAMLAGHWEGRIDIPGSPLDFDVDILRAEDGALSGDISIPAQNARNLPLTEITLDDRKVSFVISGIPGEPVFRGEIAEDGLSIAGTLSQSGAEFPFEMAKQAGFKAKAAENLAGFPEIVERGLKDLVVPGVAVAVVVEDEVVLAEGFGYADFESKRPMTADTLLAIGSSTKAFTTFTLGTLVDEGRLGWDVPVRNYIPWFKLYDSFATQRITPVDLITHRSGLPRHDLVWYNNLKADREDLVRRLAFLEPTAGLRERFQYNNLMFLTAGYLTEVITGKTWEDSVRAQVLEPLGMSRTNFSVRDSRKDPDHALPYRVRDKKIEIIPFRDITTVGPAGSINSTVNEMSRWVMVHIGDGRLGDKEVMNPETLQKMHLVHMPMGGTPAVPEITPGDYGLGWMIDGYRGHRRVHHGGNIDGFSAMVSLFPQAGFGIVALSNKNAAALPELLVRHAADLILGNEPTDWIGRAAEARERGEDVEKQAEERMADRRIKGTRPSHAMVDYTGTYFHPGYGELTIAENGDALSLVYNGIEAPLEPWHYDTFNAGKGEDPTFEGMKINFQADVQGRIARLEAPFEATLDPIVFDKRPDPRLFDRAYLEKLVGRYRLVDQIITISLKGDTLTASIPGQAAYEMVPDLGGEFYFKRMKTIGVKFLMNDEGDAEALELIQPDGIYRVERIPDEDDN